MGIGTCNEGTNVYIVIRGIFIDQIRRGYHQSDRLMESLRSDSTQVHGGMAAGSIAAKRLRREGEQERKTQKPEGSDSNHHTRGNCLNRIAVIDLEEKIPMFIPVGHLRKKVRRILAFKKLI